MLHNYSILRPPTNLSLRHFYSTNTFCCSNFLLQIFINYLFVDFFFFFLSLLIIICLLFINKFFISNFQFSFLVAAVSLFIYFLLFNSIFFLSFTSSRCIFSTIFSCSVDFVVALFFHDRGKEASTKTELHFFFSLPQLDGVSISWCLKGPAREGDGCLVGCRRKKNKRSTFLVCFLCRQVKAESIYYVCWLAELRVHKIAFHVCIGLFLVSCYTYIK